MTSPILAAINRHIDAADAALLAQDAPAAAQACQQLQTLLQESVRGATREDWSQEPALVEARLTEQRLQRLRQTLLQQSAATTRALAVLLPEPVGAGYGAPSAFGSGYKAPHTKRYEA